MKLRRWKVRPSLPYRYLVPVPHPPTYCQIEEGVGPFTMFLKDSNKVMNNCKSIILDDTCLRCNTTHEDQTDCEKGDRTDIPTTV